MAKQVKINPGQLSQAVTSIGGITPIIADGVVSDDTKEDLVACATLISDTSVSLQDTVSKYSDFLNTIADEFKNTDYQISSKIQNDKSYITDGKVNPSDDYFAAK